MTAVIQRITNFLGGVSQQADEKLIPGQVKDALNCYPDVTLGMIKRPGGKYESQLANAAAKAYDNAAWLTVFRSETEEYTAVVLPDGTVKVWDLKTGTEATLTEVAASKAYLAYTDYRSIKAVTINDFTYIVNSEKVVKALPKPTFNKNRQALVSVHQAAFATEYTVKINGTAYTFKTRTDYVTGSPPPEVAPLKLSEITEGIKAKIPAQFNPVVVDNSIYLTSTSDMDVIAEAGGDGKYLRVVQDSVDTFNRLPEQAPNGYIVKVANTSNDKDDFYLKFVADNGTSGKGTWEETRSPAVSPGLDPTTMPQVMIRYPDGTFKVVPLDGSVTINGLPIKWEDRLVGDDETNTHPSFIDNKIRDLFFFNNRFGFLTGDNVSMSQAGDYYNFYHKTAVAQTISDPIDLSCASIKPAILHAVVPVSQGLLLFSSLQQFLMEAIDGAWTPANVTIRTISNYECDEYIKPADIGQTVVFLTKNNSWSRVFEIFTRGQQENPTVTETTDAVPEWVPANITDILGSPQNSLLVASSRSSNSLYLYKFYDQGEERKLSSWVRWQVTGNVIHTSIQNDTLYTILTTDQGYMVHTHKLVQSPTNAGLVNFYGNKVDPYLDGWREVTNRSFANRSTKVYIPTNIDITKPLAYVVGLSKTRAVTYDSGLYAPIKVETDATGNFFKIHGDVTDHYIFVGYVFDFSLILPRYNYNLGDQGYDYTGRTVTARMKFYTGLGGAIYFKLKVRGRQDWKDTAGIRVANQYEGNDPPFKDYHIYKVPVHQRPDNYSMQVFSDNPFPVSLVAMEWEGQFSPGFYGRS